MGACSLELEITEGSQKITVLFSGDLGRYDQPILYDPEKPPRADVVLCESTYGDRDHPSDPPAEQALADVINRVAKRGGVIVVPAFAVDRTQLLAVLRAQARRRQPAFRSCRFTWIVPWPSTSRDIYLRHPEDCQPQFQDGDAVDKTMSAHNVHIMRSVEESKQINDVHMPAIITHAPTLHCSQGIPSFPRVRGQSPPSNNRLPACPRQLPPPSAVIHEWRALFLPASNRRRENVGPEVDDSSLLSVTTTSALLDFDRVYEIG